MSERHDTGNGAPGDLSGKTIVLTGASSGLGREAAKELAALGAHIAVVGRDPERTAAVAREVGGRAFRRRLRPTRLRAGARGTS